jgi:hypothetical protein
MVPAQLIPPLEENMLSTKRKSVKLSVYERLCVLCLNKIFFCPLFSSPMKQAAGSFALQAEVKLRCY